MIVGKNAPKAGIVPAVMLYNPKNAHNVATTVRAASCYGLNQVWFTGNRVHTELEGQKRIPREERMKGYKDVDIIHYDRPLEQFEGATPVAIEVRPDSEFLPDFEHPENAVYVFGPEDGSIGAEVLRHCHRFVVIPTRHCLNLATAVTTVLYDRQLKEYYDGKQELTSPGEWEERGPVLYDRKDLSEAR